MCFTYDSKAIAFLTKEPDSFLCIFMFDKAESVFIGRASNSNQVGRAEFLACNPSDSAIVAIGGDHMIKVMNKTEKGFGQIGAVKADGVKVTSLVWISGEVLIVGTSNNELLLVEGGELKAKFVATEVECIDLTKIQDEDSQMATQSLASLKLDKDEEQVAEEVDVMCLTSFLHGFAFAIQNVVFVFEKETQFRFLKKSLITVPVTLYAEKLYKITNMAINAQQVMWSLSSDIFL
jgi:cilia- and flagella-associated protein 57